MFTYFKFVNFFYFYKFQLFLGGNLRPQDLAKRERELGNECFNSNDYEEALLHYNTSIDIHPTPEAKNNRAMSCKHNLSLNNHFKLSDLINITHYYLYF